MYFFAKNTVSITLFLGSGSPSIFTLLFKKRISKEALWATITFVCKNAKNKGNTSSIVGASETR